MSTIYAVQPGTPSPGPTIPQNPEVPGQSPAMPEIPVPQTTPPPPGPAQPQGRL